MGSRGYCDKQWFVVHKIIPLTNTFSTRFAETKVYYLGHLIFTIYFTENLLGDYIVNNV